MGRPVAGKSMRHHPGSRCGQVGAGVRKPSILRVLLVSSGSGSRGGGEIFLDYLGKGLNDRGHEVLMWIPAHPRMDELAERCTRFARIVRADYRNTYDH